MIKNIITYQLKDLLRSKWILFYGAFFYLITEILLQFSGNESKSVIGILNMCLILVPVISIIYGSIYVYNSREFIELMLTQPIKRFSLYVGLYFGLAIPMALMFVLGVGIPLVIFNPSMFFLYFYLLISGTLITFSYIGIAFLISFLLDDKAKGIGACFLFWMLTAIFYDGLIMFLIWKFEEYPLEVPIIISAILNPIDSARVMVMLKLDIAALLGYTGAVFEKFFGTAMGLVISISSLLFYIITSFYLGLKVFLRKDF